MRVQHPRAVAGGTPPARVDVRGERVDVDADGWFEVPDDADAWLQAFADAHDVDPAAIRESTIRTCGTVKSDGEVCGRELPCRYHTEG